MGAFRKGARWLVPLALASALQLAGAPAQAQNSNNKADAFVLFKRGRLLMEAKRYSEACPVFAESYRLDPTGGTLLNLAYCNEQDNRTATAWAYYQDLLDRSVREKRNDRARYAQERLAALEPKLPRWTLMLGSNESLSGVEVLRDGQSMPRPLWGTPIPVDPGSHQIEVAAPGHKRWATTFRAVAAQALTTNVPPLEIQPPEAASGPPSESPTPATVIVEAPRESPPAAEAPRTAPGSTTGRTVAGALLGGVGALGLGLGTYFGLTAFERHNEVQRLCGGPEGCEGPDRDRANDHNEEGRRYAHFSTASFGVGVVSLGLGAYLLFIAPGSSSKASASTSVVPQIAPRSAGLSLTHTW